MNEIVRQIGEIRALCQLMVEQQDGIFRLISDKLDKFEAGVISADSKCIGLNAEHSGFNTNENAATIKSNDNTKVIKTNENAKGASDGKQTS